MILISTTVIGADVYSCFQVMKPLFKCLFVIPKVKQLFTWIIVTRFGMSLEGTYNAAIKILVFMLAYAIAYEMGNRGDLLVLLGRNAHSSYLGFALTAGIIASGDLAIDAFEQSRKDNF